MDRKLTNYCYWGQELGRGGRSSKPRAPPLRHRRTPSSPEGPAQDLGPPLEALGTPPGLKASLIGFGVPLPSPEGPTQDLGPPLEALGPPPGLKTPLIGFGVPLPVPGSPFQASESPPKPRGTCSRFEVPTPGLGVPLVRLRILLPAPEAPFQALRDLLKA